MLLDLKSWKGKDTLNDCTESRVSFLFRPEVVRGDGHGLRPDGAGGGDHEEEEAADPEHLEGRVQDWAGFEPGLLLHPLHDDGQGEHAGRRHGDPGDDHLQRKAIKILRRSFHY